MAAGAPRVHDREELARKFLAYIKENDVPIAAEFAYQNGIHRQNLYEMPELSDALKLCMTKKEASLEKGGLSGDLNTTMAIFSLKQIGWKDAHDHNIGGQANNPLVVSGMAALQAMIGEIGEAAETDKPEGA